MHERCYEESAYFLGGSKDDRERPHRGHCRYWFYDDTILERRRGLMTHSRINAMVATPAEA